MRHLHRRLPAGAQGQLAEPVEEGGGAGGATSRRCPRLPPSGLPSGGVSRPRRRESDGRVTFDIAPCHPAAVKRDALHGAEADLEAFELVGALQALEGAEGLLSVGHLEAGAVVSHEEDEFAVTGPIHRSPPTGPLDLPGYTESPRGPAALATSIPLF